MVITNESPTGPFQNETLTAGSQEEKKIPPEKVTSSAVDIVSFCEDDKVTNNSSKADEKNIIHHSSILPSNNGSISGIEIAAKRILKGGPGHTLSDWMNNQSILSVRPLPSDHSQSFSTFGIPKSFQYNTMLSYPYAYRQHLPDTTPPIFQNTPLRRGKWTIEEETYANAIIEAFERGALQGCENGCTLRAYLSRKLHCQPMRISKKYAGKSIGKQVFLSRLNAPPGRRMSCGDSTEKLRHLEFQFHMSLIQEASSAAPGTEMCALPQVYPNCPNPCSLGQQPDTQQLGFNKNVMISKSVHDQKRLPLSNSTSESGNNRRTYPTNHKQDVNDFPVVSESYPNCSKTHIDLFKALQQAQTSYFVSNMNSKPSSVSAESQIHAQTTTNESDHSSTLNSAESYQDLIKSLNSVQGQAQENWINETMALIPSLDPSKYDTGRSTPTYTSKSFDDLHQFIGKGLPSHESENERSKSKSLQDKFIGPASNAANNLMRDLSQTTVFHHPISRFADAVVKGNNLDSSSFATNFISDADEYSYLAMQSAVEASKHSAYHLPPTSSTTTTNITNTLSQNQKDPQSIIHGSTLKEYLQQKEPMTFRNTNLNLLEKTRQQRARMPETHRVSPLSETPWASKLTSESSFLMNSPMVSGSERSTSEFGTDQNSASCMNTSGLTSSDDNSDSTSNDDEGKKAKELVCSGKRIAENSEKQSNRKKTMQCQ